ncbi:ubiquitin-conjugating enzyme E2 U [Macrotis lagotis]|uniref:ubiquitin-conjugating enzyme E2 U n=1 Tax=Macrotis lagotis TaxID=92651 RepID=UPI003D68F5F0
MHSTPKLHCRAVLLLEKEFKDLQEQNLYGIAATPLTEDSLKWLAEIKGLKKSDWEGFTFHLLMKFSTNYNSVPPDVTFSTIPFHPNVVPESGRPCIDFLDNLDHWNSNYTLSSILLSIQKMLSYPSVINPANYEAAKMMVENKALFRRLAEKSLYVNQGLEEDYEDSTTVTSKSGREMPGPSKKTLKQISFDEYYKTWSEIATSQTANCLKIPVSQPLLETYKKWKDKNMKTGRDWDAKFHSIMSRIARENRLPTKLDRSLLQSIKNAQNSTSDADVLGLENKGVTKNLKVKEQQKKTKNTKESDDMDEAWENEVENLVAWTNELNTTTLED